MAENINQKLLVDVTVYLRKIQHLQMILAVYENLAGEQKDQFTVGIEDDVTHTSLKWIT
jgi:hypothetical protein